MAGAGIASGGSLGSDIATAELQDGAVTLAKMADLAQDKFIGRTTASTGVPETATITAAARTVLDDTTVSAMLDTLGGTAATGTGGVVRATSPTLVTPVLGTPTSGSLGACTGGKHEVEAFTAGDTLITAESGKVCTNTGAGGAVTLTLPAATGSGVYYIGYCTVAQNLVFDAAGTDVIQNNASASSAGGTLTAGAVGRGCCIADVASGVWGVLYTIGAWTAA